LTARIKISSKNCLFCDGLVKGTNNSRCRQTRFENVQKASVNLSNYQIKIKCGIVRSVVSVDDFVARSELPSCYLVYLIAPGFRVFLPLLNRSCYDENVTVYYYYVLRNKHNQIALCIH
jgi:hypothetical protein